MLAFSRSAPTNGVEWDRIVFREIYCKNLEKY